MTTQHEAGPATVTPPRRPGSVRRTTTHDSVRPDGLLGLVTVTARGRDLRTEPDGGHTVLDAARVQLVVDHPRRQVHRIDAEPGHPNLGELVGANVSAGFRGAVAAALPGERESGSVRFQLFDDLPTALLVGGYAVAVGQPQVAKPVPRPRSGLQYPDLCAGWIAEGTLMSRLNATGVVPTSEGPLAPEVELEDLLGWHEHDPMPPHGMRRRRRLDVWRDGDIVRVEGFFRDSHRSGEGVETVVHEYTVHATVDPGTRRFLAAEAVIGALPWPECPVAAASAGRLAGMPVAGLRAEVRRNFTGPSTCTHLNDTLRALEDVDVLLDKMP
ncbi:DUF2889 domain-containing protein [Nocardia sp. alder85J]|uniref:DUF2889 domain-containing protein n=1 Tax=Nocardia sp. alder85J TaxID=2862949 RepID=UPI001CD813A0|nr:DUF2889 domain-containing protein [Nocardia sp. alder85J]MCX4091905.1 DUF2889 domain-containing protein [Nocardia sp. alder85J]